jgi:hypothetical protein
LKIGNDHSRLSLVVISFHALPCAKMGDLNIARIASCRPFKDLRQLRGFGYAREEVIVVGFFD